MRYKVRTWNFSCTLNPHRASAAMKRGRREKTKEQEKNEKNVHVSPPKKAKKRKITEEEREVSEKVEPPSDLNGSTGKGSEVPLSKKLKTKKKKKSEKESKSETIEEIPAADDAPSSRAQSSGSARGRKFTVSIALPGSIVDNAQTLELKTCLAGQIARAAVVFCVDEIIVFNERGKPGSGTPAVMGKSSDPNVFLARLLEYQETPQYLRKTLFPMHHDLKYAGLLNPLDCPHHMRVDDVCPYREGVVLDTGSSGEPETSGSQIDCGMRKTVVIDKELEVGTRVTVRLNSPARKKGGGREGRVVRGEPVAPSVPRSVGGLYWGYTVRLADSFSAVFTDSPHQGGYDLTIGTSERGENVDRLSSLPPFQHLLVVFGGLKGLEYALECDEALKMEDVSLLFHRYLNTCPAQGSRTIRTEEALLISLAALRPLIITTNDVH